MNSIVSKLLALIKDAAAVYAVIAAVFYVILRLAYVQFYHKIGVSPEEVGLGRTELLSQALTGPVAIAVLTVVTLSLPLLLVGVVFALCVVWLTDRQPNTRLKALRRLRDYKSAHGPNKAFLRALWWWVKRSLVVAIAIATLFTFQRAYINARSLGVLVVKRGVTIDTVFRHFLVYEFPVLEIRAQPVTLRWKDGATVRDLLGRSPACMLYLGQANKIIVLYDVRNHEAVRVPSEGAIIEVDLKPKQLAGTCSGRGIGGPMQRS